MFIEVPFLSSFDFSYVDIVLETKDKKIKKHDMIKWTLGMTPGKKTPCWLANDAV